jgi:mRNA interferase YafQ
MERREMREIARTSQFKKDFKKLARSGRYDLNELLDVIEMLSLGKLLPEQCEDHPLSGEWKDHRDCHIRPDWLLIYCLEPDRLTLVRTGTHSALYK